MALCRRGGGVDTGSCSTRPRVCYSQWAIEVSHKVLYYRPMKNERITYFILTCLGFFFLFCLFTKQQQERKMQEANEPGTSVQISVQIRREQGDRT